MARKQEKKKKKSAKNTKSKRKTQKRTRKKREKEQYPGLNKRLFSKIKQEYHDIDYINQLSPAEKDYMSKFMEEFLGARINHEGKKIHKKLNTKAGRKKIFDPNNARNRDIYSNVKAQGMLSDIDPRIVLEARETSNPEDAIIEYLDSKKSIE